MRSWRGCGCWTAAVGLRWWGPGLRLWWGSWRVRGWRGFGRGEGAVGVRWGRGPGRDGGGMQVRMVRSAVWWWRYGEVPDRGYNIVCCWGRSVGVAVVGYNDLCGGGWLVEQTFSQVRTSVTWTAGRGGGGLQ